MDIIELLRIKQESLKALERIDATRQAMEFNAKLLLETQHRELLSLVDCMIEAERVEIYGRKK